MREREQAVENDFFNSLLVVQAFESHGNSVLAALNVSWFIHGWPAALYEYVSVHTK
jgi:hypothetical protein